MSTYTRQIKIAGRNHILPPLGIAWKTTEHIDNSKEGISLNVIKLSKISSTRQSSSNSIRTSIKHGSINL
jgi:hypothetical protein